MELLRFLEREAQGVHRRLFGLNVLAGTLNLFILFALTLAAASAVQRQSNLWELAAVVVGLWALWRSQGFILRRMTLVAEAIVEKVRLRIADKIRDSDLRSMEDIWASVTLQCHFDTRQNGR